MIPRRSFLKGIARVLGLLALARAAGRGVAYAGEIWTQIAGLTGEITPVEAFYIVSKNIFDPAIDAKGWTLAVKGMVDHPDRLTLAALRQLPAVTKPHTLMCISNEIGGDLLSNAVWRGVRLRTVLEKAGVRPGATKLILRAHDGYSDSFPLSVALLDGTILAYEMSGRPLERQHGFPLRALVVGLYGIKNVKWLSELEVVGQDYKGYWQQRGWTDSAAYKTFSRIDVPTNGTALKRGERGWIAGVAFAGDRGIKTVEVSVDGGGFWRPAQTKPALGDHTWALWALEWTPTVRGAATVVVRAVDGTGTVQPIGPKPPLPDGVEGWHTISVRVA